MLHCLVLGFLMSLGLAQIAFWCMRCAGARVVLLDGLLLAGARVCVPVLAGARFLAHECFLAFAGAHVCSHMLA